MCGVFCLSENPNSTPETDVKYTRLEVITEHTIDNITYTIKSRSSEKATQTLREKLDAVIARDIAKMI